MTTTKKTAKKTTKQTKAVRERAIKRANAAFAKMTPAQKRVQIARDVIAQLDENKLIAQFGTWVAPTDDGGAFEFSGEDQQVRDALSGGPCHACALGSLFVCAVTRADKLRAGELHDGNEKRGYIGKLDVFEYLGRFFDQDQLDMIETVFEGGGGSTWHSAEAANWAPSEAANWAPSEEEPSDLMRLIMLNVIKNRGQFSLSTAAESLIQVTTHRLVETDNFGDDFPNESFVNLPRMSQVDAHAIAGMINKAVGPNHPRFWKVVDSTYVLHPGFSP